MKRTITKQEFIDTFRQSERGESWTQEGLGHFYDALLEREREFEEELELDVIALDCTFGEFTDLEDLKLDYESLKDVESFKEAADALNRETLVLHHDDQRIIFNTEF